MSKYTVSILMAVAIATAGLAPSALLANEPMAKADHSDEMAECRAMMTKHHKETQQAYREMDARLQDLVTVMNATSDKGKTASMVAVLNELVDQQMGMRQGMSSMHSARMQHMSGDGNSMMEMMSNCPMMASATDAEDGRENGGEEHSKHHP